MLYEERLEQGIYKLCPEQINFSPTNRNECPKVTEVVQNSTTVRILVEWWMNDEISFFMTLKVQIIFMQPS